MGGFINTTYYDTQDSIMSLSEDLVKNPFYLFNDKKGTKVTYYNINTEKSTLDPGSKIAYADLGPNSPIRYNKINDLYIYQFQRIELDFDDDEFGLENNPIEGESFILPNLFTPMDGDFFEVQHIKERNLLFRVIKSQIDTLENGANVYRIQWKLDRVLRDEKPIEDNVVGSYKYVNVESGTNLKSIVREERYEAAYKLDSLSITLAGYFYELFYSPLVQTFIYKWYNNENMYDPFAIEFMIRNKILRPIEKRVIVTHQTQIPATFSIDYNQSFFRAFELKDKHRLLHSQCKSQADFIDDMTSIFHSRYEDYYALNHRVINEPNGPLNPRMIINLLDEEVINSINSNCLYGEDEKVYLNTLIKYFNDTPLDADELSKGLEVSDFFRNPEIFDKDVFYQLLLLIFCIDCEIKRLLS